MLDIDNPTQALNAAQRFASSITAITNAVDHTIADFTPRSQASSALDHQLVAVLDWITTTFAAATTATAEHAHATCDAVEQSIAALVDVDTDTAATIDRHTP